ncbi:MAG: lysozyme inhibitor LprI family protein [Hyphomicrobium sp.]
MPMKRLSRTSVVFLAASATLPSPTLRAEEAIDCANAMATVEMNACAEKLLEKADAALNETYKKALTAVPEMAGEKPYDAKGWEEALRASQRAWVAFRDAECNNHVAMFWTGGSGATADILGCMTDKTEARTKELKARYEAE